ncbi:DUF262 domain-containing protein [Methylotenera sp.]|uniref:DUF262 domain-containing protein n=1 Tax=Methylotenera sp. TaxID=2051956 RepID=UPI002724E3F0|nr:DUF262 domain-containing protein [Methylotenera sp.]MDO9206555.1 DUF262 domain-containing protein [Methylotenera sp.]
MDKKTLKTLFAESLFQIPDYQRGYAWEKDQLIDFIQDIDALVEDKKVTSHYTGTVVVYRGSNAKTLDYERIEVKVVDVVDGQQRLTTSCLYLSVIIRALIKKGELEYQRDISDFLYSGPICKLTLNNDTGGIFYDLLKNGRPNTVAKSSHEKRLIDAYNRFQAHIDNQLARPGVDGIAYLKELYKAITTKLHFTYYTIEEECEIGMTFELMNSRGKDLSILELLKNYLMHWISRNADINDRSSLTAIINKNWKDTYTNIGSCTGDEDQCLRIAWTLYCTHSPANWVGYKGFKGDDYIPLRSFTKRSQEVTRKFIEQFANELAVISSHYAIIISPTKINVLSQDEFLWLSKIHHTGNIANFLPLMVAVRNHRSCGSISEQDYIKLLQALECYAYRVFLFQGKRSNAGKSSFHRWAFEILNKPQLIDVVIASIYELTRYYASEESFKETNTKPSNWYGSRNRLKYTLFEYELHLLATEGKGKEPNLIWEQLGDSTIEHILPQTPKVNSNWTSKWSPDEINTYLLA